MVPLPSIPTDVSTAQLVNPGGPKELGEAVERQRAQVARIAQELGIRPKQWGEIANSE